MRLLPFVLLSLVAYPAVAEPASPAQLTVGARVRLAMRTSPGDHMKGTISALDDETLTVVDDGQHIVRVPRDGLSQLDVGFGRKTHARRGALIGAAVMVASSALYCSVDYRHFDSLRYADDGNPCGPAEVVSSVAFSAGIGAAIGALVKTDRWVPLQSLDVDLVLPKGRGFGVAVAVRF